MTAPSAEQIGATHAIGPTEQATDLHGCPALTAIVRGAPAAKFAVFREPVSGDRGSPAERSRKGRLRLPSSRRTTDTGVPATVWLSPRAKVLDLKWRVRCRGCRARRASRRVARWWYGSG